MIDSKLLLKDYYLDKMSLFLKNSYGIIDREEIYIAILNNLNDVGKLLIYSFDIFEGDDLYFSRLGYDPDSIYGAELDILASFYGVSRTKKIKYSNTEETITMTNAELKFYLQVIITRLNYQGTNEELSDLYKSKNILYKQTLSSGNLVPLSATIICTDSTKYGTALNPTTLGKLVLSDELLVESLGIEYIKSIGEPVVGTFDSSAIFDSGNYVFSENTDQEE